MYHSDLILTSVLNLPREAPGGVPTLLVSHLPMSRFNVDSEPSGVMLWLKVEQLIKSGRPGAVRGANAIEFYLQDWKMQGICVSAFFFSFLSFFGTFKISLVQIEPKLVLNT